MKRLSAQTNLQSILPQLTCMQVYLEDSKAKKVSRCYRFTHYPDFTASQVVAQAFQPASWGDFPVAPSSTETLRHRVAMPRWEPWASAHGFRHDRFASRERRLISCVRVKIDRRYATSRFSLFPPALKGRST